jgi:hypothetical protein
MCARHSKKQPGRRRKPPRPSAPAFYTPHSQTEPPTAAEASPDAAEQPRDLTPLIRARVAALLKGRPDDLSLLVRSAEALIRTIAAERRLSGKQEKDLADRVYSVMSGFERQLNPLAIPEPDP